MPLKLPEGDFKAYLFDCDGTIADSMPLHYIAWDRALREYGCNSFTEELFYAWGGRPVCAGDYAHPKPAPDPFLLAAERLGVAPHHCLVFEDADIGIQSATSAGMASVRIAQPHERQAQPQEGQPPAISR